MAGRNQGRFAIAAAQGTNYGGNHATAGISVGTNGISVLVNTTNYIPAILVYDAPITDWTHVALVFHASRPSLYLNGQLVRTGAQVRPGLIVHPGHGIGGAPDQKDFGRFCG
ncbi:MAG: LamG-like jellyroll fold domain-containing protein [Limisphaerales bacterium]